MPTERKLQQVADLETRLKRSLITIGLDYRGLSVAQMQDLRRALREQHPGLTLRVVKNTMVERAAANAGAPGLTAIVQQATALIFSEEDEIGAAKALTKFARERRIEIPVYGAFMDGAVLSPAEVADLAGVPSRPELMARLAGGVAAPVGGIAGGISNLIRGLAAIIEARAAQLETAGNGGE